MELNRNTGVLWFAAEAAGVVLRRTPDGAFVGAAIETGTPGDLSVSSNRGLGWVVSLTNGSVTSYGPDLNDATPRSTIGDVPDPRIVEAGTTDPTVWIGNEGGQVYRFQAQDLVRTHLWSLGQGPIRAIALDEARGGAWVATRSPNGTLFYLDPVDSSATVVRSPLLYAADLAVDPATGDLWIAERGPANLGGGRLKKDEKIDPSVGVVLLKKVGDRVQTGEPLATIHAKDAAQEAIHTLEKAYRIGDEPPKRTPLLLERLQAPPAAV
jgi:hypothetical protein